MENGTYYYIDAEAISDLLRYAKQRIECDDPKAVIAYLMTAYIAVCRVCQRPSLSDEDLAAQAADLIRSYRHHEIH